MSGESGRQELPIFVKWMDFLKWLFVTTEKFPKKVRFTLSNRINNLALDIVEDLVEARYSRDKIGALQRANLRLEKIRLLMRIAHEQKILPHKSYKFSAYSINEIGKMLGGWKKQQQVKG